MSGFAVNYKPRSAAPRSSRIRAGNARRDRKRSVEILGLNQIIAAELLARLRERTVGRQRLAVAHAYRKKPVRLTPSTAA